MTKGKFTGYPKSADLDKIKRWFEDKHGYAPSEILDGGSIWLAGPLRGTEPEGAHQARLPGMGAR